MKHEEHEEHEEKHGESVTLRWRPRIALTRNASFVFFVFFVFHAFAFPPAPERQTVEEAQGKSSGCVTCHKETDRHTMHQNPAVVLGCTDCHGVDANIRLEVGGVRREDPQYLALMRKAHVLPRDEKAWK